MNGSNKANPIKASIVNSSILGTYEGEAMDTNITNKNGIDITKDVIEVVLESDDYIQGVANGWFIGYLGHPVEPDCMEFERGCIVLKAMRIEPNGKVYCTFDLVNTPVGQIVKTFIDAGVKFGISIRGAGDIVGNSVDPETFIFRGYDLVAFPAYPESIPTFTSVAASTDLIVRKKYQAVCAAIKTNYSKINDCSTLDIIQSQFAPQSDEYRMIEDRKSELNADPEIEDITNQKIEAMTQLYLKSQQSIRLLASKLESAKRHEAQVMSSTRRKIDALNRITSAQQAESKKSIEAITASYEAQKNTINRLKSANKNNLIYQQRINASEKTVKDKDRIIASLQSKLHETVTASKQIATSTSNLDGRINRLTSENAQCTALLASYQQAYASLYANALGVNASSIAIKSTMSVKELQSKITSATNTCNIAAAPVIETAAILDPDDDCVNDDLITM